MPDVHPGPFERPGGRLLRERIQLLGGALPQAAQVMKLLSVNVGLPREVQSGRTRVLTSIFKSPVDGRVAVVGDNLAGDQQSDLSVQAVVPQGDLRVPF